MQKSQYDNEAKTWTINNKNPVVGWYGDHESSPLYDTELFRGLKIDKTKDKALDFGCGPGRCIVRFNDMFSQIDGCDISQVNLDNALLNLEDAGIEYTGNLFVNNGQDIPADDDTYNIVFSVICLQHIACHDIRMSIMKDVYRILTSGGTFSFQMGAGKRPNSASYYSNEWDAKGTNGSRDVQVDVDDNDRPFQLVEDLEKLGFEDIQWTHTNPIQDLHDSWIWVQARKP